MTTVHPPITSGFPLVLRAVREAAGLTQSRLALLTGIDRSLICRWEAGQRAPSRETLSQLCERLDLDTHDRARLFLAAGFAPDDPTALLADEPVLMRARVLLEDAHPSVAQRLRAAIADAVWLAEHAAQTASAA